MQCHYCGAPLTEAAPGRQRTTCNDACRQALFRRNRKLKIVKVTEASAELKEARGCITDLESQQAEARQRITDLEHELTASQETIATLQYALRIEERYRIDTKSRGLQAWLKKQSQPTPLMQRILADMKRGVITPRVSRSMCEASMRKLGYTSDEIADFAELWKALLAAEPP